MIMTLMIDLLLIDVFSNVTSQNEYQYLQSLSVSSTCVLCVNQYPLSVCRMSRVSSVQMGQNDREGPMPAAPSATGCRSRTERKEHCCMPSNRAQQHATSHVRHFDLSDHPRSFPAAYTNSSPDLELHILHTAQHLYKPCTVSLSGRPVPPFSQIAPYPSAGTAPDEECPAGCEGSRAA